MRRIVAGLVAGAGLAGPAAAQSPLPPGAVRMDPGVSDRGIGVGRVDLRLDLRQQNDFASVYRFSMPSAYGGAYGSSAGRSMLVRIEGNTAAVFPESVYVPTAQGVMPTVPPGTIFYIGGLPRTWPAPREEPLQRAPNYLDLRADALVRGMRDPRTGAVIPPPGAPAAEATSLWNSEGYRVREVTGLLDRAAASRD